ncbi:hypothetical protein [Acinetobacter cumulans]|uniref:hypothetical protein n=1 Tax=Acinetobacter cumulans TaxID=2136182 RepID=UPI001BC89415|nr:hypothetical protein [Acinetobacter cumulans]
MFFQDVKKNNFNNKNIKILVEKFNEIFQEELSVSLDNEAILESIKKLNSETDVEYLKEDKDIFESLVRNKIYKYSEVDLSIIESQEIIIKLLNMVKEKTGGVIKDLTKENIEKFSAISINELLNILSITYGAYESLIESGDEKAIKSVSIIQRILKKSGAGDEVIAYCTRCKSKWDLWLRKSRHNIPEYELNMILIDVSEILSKAISDSGSISISKLRDPIKEYYEKIQLESRVFDLNEDLILGGIFSE